MNRIGVAILVLIFVGTAFMIGFLAYNFSIVYYPVPHVHNAVILSKTSTTTNTTSTSTSNMTTTSSLPSGATALPYNSANKTVFLYIVASSSGQPFNFNGTSNGQLHVYVPAGWTVLVHFTNQEGLTHNFLIVSNTTATPGDDVGQDGSIVLAVGTTTSSYLNAGLSSGQSATGSATLPAGIYWFVCGIEGHAAAGMWGVIVSSTSVTTLPLLPTRRPLLPQT
ncbi:sulfocyanin [Metallosphaera tengchongensis]|uniref:Sulfocyanin n=1 Tax=Metallosphaera tengchongensis TaxID=1532350 RepID=A0A6N0NZD1_9CREN|nr:sulfocyanin-like copper-binding protein [Metallosphaera tengchongensis]QKR00899.1 sulfocyanin [Metallosphaera tengchongensis]